MYESEKVKVLVAQSCLSLCDLMDCSPPVSSVHGILQVRILEWVAIHSLLQGIFPTQGLNLGLLHCRQILYYLNHQRSPLKIWNASRICMSFLTNAKKKIIYHISLAFSVDHREGRGIRFCDMSTKSGWGIINLEFRVQMPGFKFQLYTYWL